MRLLAALLILAGVCGAVGPFWTPLEFLVGEWDGTGGGGPGQGAGWFSVLPDLQGTVLVRRNHAEYPKEKTVHDDLMVIYRNNGRLRADYWDTEGHIIRYAVTAARDTALFLSEGPPEAPRFRLTYTKTGADTVAIRFEVAPPGKPDAFATYINATAIRRAGRR